jgi:hypothetical protein
VDVAPKKKTTPRERVAQCLRLLGSKGERRNAWTILEPSMQSAGISWTDIGNAVEDNRYTESEMQEYGQIQRAEGVEAGIKIGMTRAHNGSGNGHFTLPSPAEMADFCHARRGQLKDDSQRQFIDEMVVKTHNQMPLRNRLAPGTLGFLASLYIKHGGRI